MVSPMALDGEPQAGETGSKRRSEASREARNHKYKETFHVKAKMLSADEVEPLVGHPVGGVCPFVPNDGVRIDLDASLRRFDTVYPACGSPSSAIGLTIPELEKYAAPPAAWVDVCKIPE